MKRTLLILAMIASMANAGSKNEKTDYHPLACKKIINLVNKKGEKVGVVPALLMLTEN